MSNKQNTNLYEEALEAPIKESFAFTCTAKELNVKLFLILKSWINE